MPACGGSLCLCISLGFLAYEMTYGKLTGFSHRRESTDSTDYTDLRKERPFCVVALTCPHPSSISSYQFGYPFAVSHFIALSPDLGHDVNRGYINSQTPGSEPPGVAPPPSWGRPANSPTTRRAPDGKEATSDERRMTNSDRSLHSSFVIPNS